MSGRARLHQHVAGPAVGGRTDRRNHGQKDRWLGGELGGEVNGRPAWTDGCMSPQAEPVVEG